MYCLLGVLLETYLSQHRSTHIQISDVISRGHDPIAHAGRARYQAPVRNTFIECVVVVVIVVATWDLSHMFFLNVAPGWRGVSVVTFSMGLNYVTRATGIPLVAQLDALSSVFTDSVLIPVPRLRRFPHFVEVPTFSSPLSTAQGCWALLGHQHGRISHCDAAASVDSFAVRHVDDPGERC